MIEIDARGRQCPIPVIEAKNAVASLAGPGTVTVLVDNEIAVQNIMKMAKQKGIAFTSRMISGGDYEVTLTKDGNTEGREALHEEETETENCVSSPIAKDKTVVVLSSDCMGSGDELLGRTLMKGFLYALTQQEQLPGAVILYHSGAHLSVEGSEALEDLKYLEGQGVEILTCGTCLNFYGLSEKIAVGTVTNMYTITEKLCKAGKIIKP